jgi:hypothetical protein
MFNIDTLTNSLQVSSEIQCWLTAHILNPKDKNYVWSRTGSNIFGLTELRARVGRFDIPWHPKSTFFPVPDLEQPFNKKLSEVFDQRAIEIYSKAKNLGKRIIIQWSGGIDSTAMLCAFIKNIPSTDLASIIICTTTDGIAENPYFYETQIRGKFEMVHWRELELSDEFFNNYILLTGDPGDCIFGPSTSKYKSLWSNNQHLNSWKDSLPKLYQLYHDYENINFSQWYVDKVSMNLAELQEQGLYTGIKTISDWHWWNYFNLKWQGSVTRPLYQNKKNKKSKISKKNLQEFFDLCFFAGTDFQIWSYQHLSTLCANEMCDHKLAAKNYIFDLDKNLNYRLHKVKTRSIVSNSECPLVIDQDGVHYYPGEDNVIQTFRQLLA